MRKVRICKKNISFRESTWYDANVALPIHYSGKYAQALDCFKQMGLFNADGFCVHITLIGGLQEWENRETICSGWMPEYTISLICANALQPSPKINAYYLWLRTSGLRARWHFRVDDDSITDLGTTLKHIDHTYGDLAVHLMTTPAYYDAAVRPLMLYLKSRGVALSSIVHEWESSISSSAAIDQLFEHPEAVGLFEHSSYYEFQAGDQQLALGMHMANVPTFDNQMFTKDFEFDNMILTGGNRAHIHYIDWSNHEFTSMLSAFATTECVAIQDGYIHQLIGKRLVFGRCIGYVLGRIIMEQNGRIGEYSSENEYRWTASDGKLLFSRADGTVTTVFDRMLKHEHQRWIIGSYTLESKMHFIRLDEDKDS